VPGELAPEIQFAGGLGFPAGRGGRGEGEDRNGEGQKRAERGGAVHNTVELTGPSPKKEREFLLNTHKNQHNCNI